MNLQTYLQRINFQEKVDVSLENLRKLQQSTLLNFTFENIDMHMGKHINFSLEETYDRLMNKSRGGYCLQLNTLFGWVLEQLGYEVSYMPCYLYNQTMKAYKKLETHIILIVKCDEAQYYVDVGTNLKVNEPIEFKLDHVQKTLFGTFMFRKFDNEKEMFYELIRSNNKPTIKRKNEYEWIPQFKFKLEPKPLDYFKKMNEYVQQKEHSALCFFSYVIKHSKDSIKILLGLKYTEIKFREFGEDKVDKILSLDEARWHLNHVFKLDIDDSFIPVNNLDQI